jgi:hypothetical protein
MKLLIVTSLKEFKKDVSNILKKAQIPVFSFSEITGVKGSYVPELSDDWFTSDSDREFRSVFFLVLPTVKQQKRPSNRLLI